MKYLEDGVLSPLRTELDKYEEFVKASKGDPPTEPYRSKYSAMGCLECMQESINSWPESEHHSAIQCAVLTAFGVLKAETEEFTMGEKCLTRSLEICDAVGEDRYTILARVHALMYLGVIWCGREDFKKAKEYLEKSLKVYTEFQAENNKEIYSLRDLLNPSEYTPSTQADTLESFITHAYFYLAQVVGKEGDTVRSAELCHTTLSRQLGCAGLDRMNSFDVARMTSSGFDWMDWTRNCATLSQFYLHQENFTAARYHLTAALVILDTFKGKEGEGDINGEEEVKDTEENEEEEKINATECTVYRFCGKYGLALLEYSHCEKLSREADPKAGQDSKVHVSPEFAGLDVSSRLNEVTDQRIEDPESARRTFVWTQKHYTAAQRYFTKDDRCSDYVEIARDMSQVYKHLIAFEENDENKCKMHRRRADILEPLNRELSPTYYLLTIRQILFELGEIFSDMVDLKRARWLAQPTNLHFARKVNLLVNQAVLYFQTFLDTMKVEGRDPVKYLEDNVRPALLANFYLGRLASKYIVEENSPEQLRNINTTYVNYKNIVEYCEKNPEAVPKLQEELEACKEMVRLLPVKMEKVRRNLTV